MIPFALRLAFSGGREALARLIAIAAAAAVGVGLLLSVLSGINAVDKANERLVWLNAGSESVTASAPVDPLWWHHRWDYYDGRELQVVDVAATGPTAPVPPGLTRPPAAGEYYASPALVELLRATPADQLGDRIPGTLVGELGDAALPSPDSLIAVVGGTVERVSRLDEAKAVTAIPTELPADCRNCPGLGTRGDAMTLILSVVAVALIFPVAVFIGTATRLAAARREQRYAAMRLVGATPGQVAVVAVVESVLAAVAGTAAGFVVHLLLRPLTASVPFTGERFFPEDLTLTVPQILTVALGVPVAAALAARLALRRVSVSPLGVSRRATPKPPRAWRLVPLVAGFAELAWFVNRRPESTDAQTTVYLTGFFLIMIGLVTSGPWLTMVGARALARRIGRPASLIAVRRMADDPRAAFRAVSGIALALFVTSATVGVIGAINANRGALSGDRLTRAAVSQGAMFEEAPMADRVPDALLAELAAIPGVRGVIAVHPDRDGLGRDPQDPRLPSQLVACADLAKAPVLGSCPAGAEVVTVPAWVFVDLDSNASTVWRAVPLTAAELAARPLQSVYATTDGSTAAKEKVRTLLTRSHPEHRARTVGDWASGPQRELAGWRQLANVVLLTTLPVAGCSLAVGVVAGLAERRRPFAMLRLTGVPLAALRRVVALETAVPLLVTAAVATGAGFLSAHLFLKSQMRYELVSPGAVYFALVAVGLGASLGIIASTLPLLRRITGPEAARSG
ncbi:FtsX-like permease family protein [Kitasatospora sp. NPDC054939]